MRVWLTWRCADEGAKLPGDVGVRLEEIFSELAGRPLRLRRRDAGAVGVAAVELPWRGWKPAFFQEDERTWAMSVDYPMNARPVLRRLVSAVDDNMILPSLCRELERDPLPLLVELAPPFSVVWSSKGAVADELFIENDGLGQSQVFEYDDGRLWAASNKISAFAALGVRLEPDPVEWAVWSTLGWFPQRMSGYKRVQFLEPGTRLRVGRDGVHRERFDALAHWVTPATAASPAECLELARQSLLEHLLAAVPLWEKPEVGLTAGWDSRAVVSTLRAAKVDVSLTVRGVPGRRDVMVASELARIAGLELRVQRSGGMPPDDVEECRRCITRALLWQGGHAAAHRHKTFMAGRERIKLRAPSVTGQHGEIARRERALFADDQARRVRATELSEGEYEAFMLSALMEDAPKFLRPELVDGVREAICGAYREGEQYGLNGLRRVDFFCLHEFTRRKGSAVHAWQARAVVAPFLNPGFIRAVFIYPSRREANVFHRHIIATNAPDWMSVPPSDDFAPDQDQVDWKRPIGRENYDGRLYWHTAGAPLIDEALASDGFWREVFDATLMTKHWRERADLLAVLYLL